MPFTVKFDPQSVSQQASIIPDATPGSAGVMSALQASQLMQISGAFGRAIVVTTDATPVIVANFPMPRDGLVVGILNISAANEDGTDWAMWLAAPLVISKALGVVTIVGGGGPFPPSAQAGPTSATWTIELVATADGFTTEVKGAVGVNVKWSLLPFNNYNQQF